VRLLHAGHADGGIRAAGYAPAGLRARDSRSALRQSLPLHRLPEDRRGGVGRRRGTLMRLRPFTLREPETVEEAVAALGELDGEARVVAGGTALVPMIRLGLVAPDRLISLHRVARLRGARVVEGALEIGATTTYGHVERHAEVRRGWPLLAEAAA